MDSANRNLPSTHVVRATFSSGPDDSGHLIAMPHPSKHIGALPIVLITIGACIFLGVLALVIYPAVCERLFGRPSPLRTRRHAPSLWHSPAYVNWGSTPFFKRPDGSLGLPQPRSARASHRKTQSLGISSRASSDLTATTLVTSMSEKNVLSSALYSDTADSRYRHDSALLPNSIMPPDLGSIFMSTFQRRFSIGEESTGSTGSTRGIAPASVAYSPRSASWTNSVTSLDIRTLYSQRFSRDSVYSQEAQGIPSINDVPGLGSQASLEVNNSGRVSVRCI
ncbi:hypothetical protein PENSPDRAFT_59490 [Peniophora sp. CONT]|nr:hypothetical protein PENSPDRAFT_59490 [Peniophora sp. CONT]